MMTNHYKQTFQAVTIDYVIIQFLKYRENVESRTLSIYKVDLNVMQWFSPSCFYKDE